MSSTFGSLNIAKTGLQYQQVAIDTANNNIANVNTDGYVRRRAVAAEVGGPGQPVMWSYYDGHGQGVTTQQVQRLTDILLDNRVRKESANLSYLNVQQAAMERVETAINEPSDSGVSAALTGFAKAWQDVVNAPDGEAARTSVIEAGKTLATAIGTQANALDTEIEQQRAGATQDITQINQDAQQLAELNHNIFIAQANGSDVSDLMDQRDRVALDLANKAGAVITVVADGRYTASINGVAIVKTDQYGDRALTLSANNLDTAGTPGSAALSFTITDPEDATASVTVSGLNGELGGVATLLNSTLKDYRTKLNTLASDLVSVVNAQHAAGLDSNGDPGGPFFAVGDADDPAGSMSVAITNAKNVAAAAGFDANGNPITGKSTDASNADAISQVILGKQAAHGSTTAINISDKYQSMVAGLGSTVAGLNTQTANQKLLASQVSDEREQTAGVSLDEETINLMAAQRAYEASSRVLTVMNSILDTLINRMGA